MIDASPVRIGIVDYRNARPLLFGLQHSPAMEQMATITAHYPAEVARQLLNGEIDLGLVPVAIIPQLPGAQVVSDYCIGAHGAVASVSLFSHVPLEEIEHIYLDYQSRTSVALCRLLCRDFWKIEVEFLPAEEGYIGALNSSTAGVIIGDRALEQNGRFPFVYDLSEAWLSHTGLPFMFAAWVANKPLSLQFLSAFNEANAFGLAHLKQVARAQYFPAYDLLHYYRENILFTRTPALEAARQLFLKHLQEL